MLFKYLPNHLKIINIKENLFQLVMSYKYQKQLKIIIATI